MNDDILSDEILHDAEVLADPELVAALRKLSEERREEVGGTMVGAHEKLIDAFPLAAETLIRHLTCGNPAVEVNAAATIVRTVLGLPPPDYFDDNDHEV